MNSRRRMSELFLSLVACTPLTALAQSPHGDDAKLRQLDVSAGRWVYHGHFLGHKGARPSDWTWHEDCRWSDNRAFMLCSFSNTWAGRHVDSVVVDTYDRQHETFWHYEIFDGGDSAGKPFASRMRIDGATRIESWTSSHKGKSVRERIVYEFTGDDKVSVSFQQSTDGVHWKMTAIGAGQKAAS